VPKGHGISTSRELEIDHFGNHRNDNTGAVFKERGGNRIKFALLVGKRIQKDQDFCF
jgi:hypothetical protein